MATDNDEPVDETTTEAPAAVPSFGLLFPVSYTHLTLPTIYSV